MLEFLGHDVGEGIAESGAVEGDENDGGGSGGRWGNMRDANVAIRNGLVGEGWGSGEGVRRHGGKQEMGIEILEVEVEVEDNSGVPKHFLAQKFD